MSTLMQTLAWGARSRWWEGDGRTQTEKRRPDRQQTNVLVIWHRYTSFLYGLDQADEGWGSCLRWCELLTQVRHRNSWNNNTNHCYTSGTKPLKGHRSAAALTRAQLTRSSWRYRACIMWVYIKSARNTIKHDNVDFSIHFARSTPVLQKNKKLTWNRENMKLVMRVTVVACILKV